VTTAIIVLNYNTSDETLECLRSLRGVTDRSVRIYVVDNGSRPALKASLPDVPPIRLLESPVNLGFTGGCNWGARVALEDGASHLLFLNNDTTVAPGFLEPLIRTVDSDRRIGIATPKIYFHGQERVIWAHGARLDPWTGRSVHLGVLGKDEGQFDAIREVDRVTGCAMLVRRDFIERVGLLDDRFFIYSEEVDWCLRARRLGYAMVVVPESVIWHKGHRTTGRLGRPFIAYLQARNQFLLLRKNAESFVAGASLAALYFMLSLARRCAIAPFQGEPESARAALRGFLDGLRGRFGRPPRDLERIPR
jgi:GT2 family glycosyltransferase